jgi:hypothetical protein
MIHALEYKVKKIDEMDAICLKLIVYLYMIQVIQSFDSFVFLCQIFFSNDVFFHHT